MVTPKSERGVFDEVETLTSARALGRAATARARLRAWVAGLKWQYVITSLCVCAVLAHSHAEAAGAVFVGGARGAAAFPAVVAHHTYQFGKC